MTTNPSLQKKTAARTAAVQLLYQAQMTGENLPLAQQIERLKEELKDNRGEQKLRAGLATEPDYALLDKILTGVTQHKEKVDERVDEVLSDTWARERTSTLLIAILQCAVFELFFYKDIKPSIIVDEYTRLTRSFFSDSEVDFIYAALSQLTKKYAAA